MRKQQQLKVSLNVELLKKTTKLKRDAPTKKEEDDDNDDDDDRMI
jgi:hypothetical protein